MVDGSADGKRRKTLFTGIEAPFMTPFESFPDYVGSPTLLKSPIQREMVRVNEYGKREKYLQWFNAYSILDFHVAFAGSKKFHEELFTLKHLIYLFYAYLFGVDTYVLVRKSLDSEGKRVETFGFVCGYSKGERGEDKKGEKLSKVICWHDEERAFRKFKKALSGLVGNRKYDKAVDTAKAQPILRTGEIFDYFISNAKNPEGLPDIGLPDNSTIRTAIEQSLGREGMSDEEISKGMAFVSNFLAHVL